MQVRVIVQHQLVDDLQRGRRRAALGDGHGTIQLDNRRSGELRKLAVKSNNLRPIDGVVALQAGDRRLQDVRTSATQAEGAVQPASA